jgi:amidase
VTDELAQFDATAQAELVARGELSARDLVDAAIERIERVDGRLNAVIHRRFERARDEAPNAKGPFAGVPFLVKDAVCHTAGDPFHAGMQVLKDAGWVEHLDTWLAARFRAAGFVFVGKTNTPELATSLTTEPLAYGPTRNPWDDTRSTGGSSGGSAAAVAAGLVPVAHGNDMGGSIRFPAGMCGIIGLKPTRARTTLGPDFGEYWGPLTHEFVLTRSVRDTAAVLDAVAGAAPGDPYTAPPPVRPYRDEVRAPVGRLRVGVRTETLDGEASHPDVVRAVESSARLLADLGHDVDAATIPALDNSYGRAFATVLSTAVAGGGARGGWF